MSHLTCDRVELSLHVWLENSFSVEPQERVSRSGGGHHHRRETMVCEDGMSHSNKSIFIGIHEWLLQVFVFSTGTFAQTGKMCWNVLKYMWFVHPASLHWTKGSGVFGKYKVIMLHDVYRGHISSVNLHNVNFSGNKNNDFYFQLDVSVCLKLSKGIWKVSTRRTINKTAHLSEVNMKLKTCRWWSFFCAIFDKWNKWRELITVISSKQWTPS